MPESGHRRDPKDSPYGKAIDESELLWEISNMAFVVGDVAEGTKGGHALHQTFDICAEGNLERVRSLLELGVLELRRTAGTVWTVRKEKEGWRVSGPDSVLGAGLVKEYLLCRVLGRWLEVTLPEAAPPWLSQAEEVLAKLRTFRGRPRRRRLSPF